MSRATNPFTRSYNLATCDKGPYHIQIDDEYTIRITGEPTTSLGQWSSGGAEVLVKGPTHDPQFEFPEMYYIPEYIKQETRRHYRAWVEAGGPILEAEYMEDRREAAEAQ